MARATESDRAEVLEQGHIYFMYRPRVEEDEPEDVGDVERFFVALHPDGEKRYRLIAIGGKRAPEIERHERSWGFVDMISDDPKEIEQALQEHHYETKTRGERTLPAARPAGQGAYAIVYVESGMHLMYALELPEQSDEVQRELRIAPEASFALSIKNPEKGSPEQAGLREDRRAKYPEQTQALFRDRRFDQEHPELLDYEGAEIVLVGARQDPESAYGVDLEPADANPQTAAILKDLRMAKSRHPIEPLIKGEWQ